MDQTKAKNVRCLVGRFCEPALMFEGVVMKIQRKEGGGRRGDEEK